MKIWDSVYICIPPEPNLTKNKAWCTWTTLCCCSVREKLFQPGLRFTNIWAWLSRGEICESQPIILKRVLIILLSNQINSFSSSTVFNFHKNKFLPKCLKYSSLFTSKARSFDEKLKLFLLFKTLRCKPVLKKNIWKIISSFSGISI